MKFNDSLHTILTATGNNTGTNLGTVFPHGNDSDSYNVKILRGLADKLGYSIAKKITRKRINKHE